MVKRINITKGGIDIGGVLPLDEINRVYFIFDDYKTSDDVPKCANCDCFHSCECSIINSSEPAQREKKIKQKFRPQRATPKGDGHRWKAIEKTSTTWGSPADKARKREAMRVKQHRKWRDAFLPEENDFENDNYPQWVNVRTLNFKEIQPIKIRKIRAPIRDRPCKPGFVEYTGRGWK